MKIDDTDFGVFTAKVSEKDAAAWLVGHLDELVAVNGAIDEAASHAGAYGTSFIIIKITSPDGPSAEPVSARNET